MGSKKSQGEYNYEAQVEANKTNENIAHENLDYQRETAAEQKRMNDYQIALNEKVMQREDTAIQRQVADARAAGVSPLAAGTVGQAQTGSSLMQPSAPSSLHNDYRANPAAKAGDDYEFKFRALTQISDALSQLAGNLNNTSSTASQNALRYAQIADMDEDSYWKAITMPLEIQSRRLDNTTKENYLYDSAKERAYNEKYGLNRGMTEYERLARTFLNGRGSDIIKGNLSALGTSSPAEFSVPRNFTFDDLKAFFTGGSSSPAAQALDKIGKAQTNVSTIGSQIAKSAIKSLSDSIKNKHEENKQRIKDSFRSAADSVKNAYNKAKNWFSSKFRSM